MKVLITNGSNKATWYYGRQGELHPVLYTKDAHYFVSDWDNDGPAGVHIPDGELLYTEVEYNKINQERLMRREELRKLMFVNESLNQANHSYCQTYRAMTKERVGLLRELKEARADEKLAVANADRMTDEIIELKKHIDKKLVDLPRDVADKVQNLFNNGYTPFQIISYIRKSPCYDIDRKFVSWADKHQKPFMRALADGYTIEQTKEDRINKGLKQLVETWIKEDTLGSDSSDAEQLATRIKGFVQSSVYAESTN